MKLLLATRNKNKIREIADKFSAIRDLEMVTPDMIGELPDVEETGNTFVENALLKARALCNATGIPAMSDDSGLVVDALNGRPGVMSARYGGEGLSDNDRNLLLLKELEGIQNRSARFVCVISIALPDGRFFSAEGVCEGFIGREMKGDHGFGYDPVFFLPDRGLSMAEIPLAEKNRISHRAQALEKAAKILAMLNT